MAHLWTQDARGNGRWAILTLDQQAPLDLGVTPPARLAAGPGSRLPRVLLVPIPATPNGWGLVVAPASAVRVNGWQLVGGIRVLRDRDEFVVQGVGGAYYFSTERLARIEAYDGAGVEGAACPRCRQSIAPGSPVVRCPGCSVACHEDATVALACGSYGPQCPVCGHPSALDAGFRWTPEDIAQ